MTPTPKKTASRKAEPKKSAPKKSAPRKATPKKAAPQKTASKPTAPKKSAPKKSAPKKAAPKKVAPKKTASKPAASKAVLPKKAASKTVAPKKPVSRKTVESDSILEKTRILAARLYAKQAREVRALDVRGLSSVSEAIIVATAKSLRQAKALADDVLDCCGERGFGYLGMEGYQGAEWILLDLNDVVVHVFQEETRHFYNLEGMWAEAPEIPVEAPAGDAE